MGKEAPDENCMTGNSPTGHKDLLIGLLQELGAARRFRSEAEHIYTAAAVGGFGAVAWGVAAMDPAKYVCRPMYLRPAFMGAAGILVVAVLIVSKILREHGVYADIKAAQAEVAHRLASLDGASTLVPAWICKEKAGLGAWWSAGIVSGAALGSILFCVLLLK